MKIKNKMIALFEIAIVLCSVFLVAIPAIATEQNTQKVSASEVTSASEDDFVLGIYGNANEDDAIDMRDLTYVKLIFFGKKPETELTDAKYDGKINPLDFVQIKLIIVGKEKELTIVDSEDRIVTVKKPVKRVVLLCGHAAEAVPILRAQDKVVGVSKYIKQYELLLPELSKLPNVGYVDYEVVLSLNPDFVISGSRSTKHAKKLPDIPVVGFEFGRAYCVVEDTMKLGYIFGKKDEAEYYIDDFHDKYISLIKERTEKLSEEERPKVYVEMKYEPYKAYGAGSGADRIIDLVGGRNIFADISGYPTVDPEEIIVRNPDIIIKQTKRGDSGYGVDDTSKMKAIRDEVMNRPELDGVTAVKTGRVYAIDCNVNYGLRHPVGVTYQAKWLHPDLFEGLDPQAIHQEYLTEFHGLDYDLDKHGVFVYPPLTS